MSCGCASSCNETCPETTPVTIIQYTIEGGIVPKKARYSRGAGTVTAANGKYVLMTLPNAPVNSDSVTVHGNSGAMRPIADYVVSGSQIYLVNEATLDDEYMVSWISGEASIPDPSTTSTFNPGYLQGFYSDPGTAWLAMDGVTAHSKAAYAALWLYLAMNTGLLQASDASTFTLKALSSTLYDGSSLVSVTVYIKV